MGFKPLLDLTAGSFQSCTLVVGHAVDFLGAQRLTISHRNHRDAKGGSLEGEAARGGDGVQLVAQLLAAPLNLGGPIAPVLLVRIALEGPIEVPAHGSYEGVHVGGELDAAPRRK